MDPVSGGGIVMVKSRFYQSWLVLGPAVALSLPAPANSQTTQNLLVNGNAELQSCTNDWTAQTSIPGWRVVRGAAGVLCYSAFNFSHESAGTPSNLLAGPAALGLEAARREFPP